MNEILSKIWTPVTTFEKDGTVEANVWGRKYTAREKSFLESIISQETELLAEPVRIYGIENGKECVWENATHRILPESDEVTHICSSFQSESFILNVTNTIEFDGFMDIGITIVPRGLPVEKIGGFGTEDRNYVLEKLWFEIPLKNEIAKTYQIFRRNDIVKDGKFLAGWDDYQKTGYIPDNMSAGHKGEFYVGNDYVGISVMSESAKDWQYEDEYKAIEIVREGDKAILRCHLLDSEPEKWVGKGRDNGIDMSPITFRLFLQVTPIKPLPDDLYEERAVHIDAYTKVKEDYEEYLFSEYEDSGEIILDRFKRLGVNTLYLHEKWNDMQNSFILTQKTQDRIALIVKEAHKRGMKVIPYFGFEISTFSPYWKECGEEVMRIEDDEREARMWYRVPYQRDAQVCYGSKWNEMWVKGVVGLMDKFGFDGLYLDGTIVPMPCKNEKHGCGWRDKDGNLHPTYPIRRIRKLMKEVFIEVEKRGGRINLHSGFQHTFGIGFTHSLVSGEQAQWKLMKGEIKELPEGYFRTLFAMRKTGVNVFAVAYVKEPVWTFRQGVMCSILFGVLPKPTGGEPLEIVSEIWSVLDKYDMKGATWHPYYEVGAITSSDERVKASYYEREVNGKKVRFVFCANTTIEPVSNVKLTIDGGNICVTAGMNTETFKVLGNSISLDLGNFDGCIFIAESEN